MGMAYREICNQRFVGCPAERIYRDGRPGKTETPINTIGLWYYTIRRVFPPESNITIPISSQPISFSRPEIPSLPPTYSGLSDLPPSYEEIISGQK